MPMSLILSRYIKNGIKYIYQVFTAHYTRLTPIRYYQSEAYLLFDLILQGFYLHRSGSTYSESFFNFKRSKITKDEKGKAKYLGTLSRRDKAVTLFFECVLPYIRDKLNSRLKEVKDKV